MKRDIPAVLFAVVALLGGCGSVPGNDLHADRDVADADSLGGDAVSGDAAGRPDAGHTDLNLGDGHGWSDVSGNDTAGPDVLADGVADGSSPGDAVDAGREFGIDVINIGYDPEFSLCGGFASGDGPGETYRDPFCGQPMMKWSVDPVTGEIRLTFENVYFNCCGEHEIAVENNDGIIFVTIIDGPPGSGDRCSCTCAYDYAVTMPPLKDAVQATFVLRYIVDGEFFPPESEHNAGYFWVDLTAGSGETIIDGLHPTCHEHMYQVTNLRISDCGGFNPDGERCRPETFEWSFHPDTSYLHVINRNVILNCCGERHMYAFRDPRYGMQIAQLDVPPDSGRCDCRCMFDFSMDLYVYEPCWSAEYGITRTITDAAVPDREVWNDNIDERTPGIVVISQAADNCI